MMTISIGCDHAGYPYKDSIIRMLEKQGIEVLDFGTNSPQSVDYPDFVHPTATAVEAGKAQFGIVLCGSGNGVAMTANKHQGIRCALCWKVELASLARQHNNANILALPVRYVSKKMALAMVRTFLESKFEGGRHEGRVNKIACQ
ncbi:MAG: ribose 5-phosphate isomerase B [Saprospiraceae bacterium]|nr:ribose 5-phosphate isomerase B [Saprospiraceae bacterium]MCF8251373.1 ribose 5-phosphate isomerase B [Saprospiraceae bacterium]MCF8280548.1 ribose 5-phosphate isomerase B [Bacteroidales bacterium]MCF8313234.1 ribose 5-phosphate isomerase B [Saprospiraceae bacterium]MCF8441681.1 ribose 5-phosphate isomerase B [Saprospiraceae bacterium]